MGVEFTPALCIRQWDWSETSQTVALFTRTHGLVRALAKGSKRPGAAYSGGVELLTEATAGLIFRAGSELALLTEWDLRRTFPALRTSLAAHHAALYVADLLSRMVRENDPHPELYDTSARVLAMLGSGGGPPAVAAALLRFQWDLLEHTGFRPGLSVDARTGETLPAQGACRFMPELGGFTVGEDGGWAVTWPTIDALRQTAGGHPVIGPAADRASRLLASYLRHVLGEEPATLSLVFPQRLLR